MLYVFGLIILGYLLGSIPTGYWVGKILKGIDLRQTGSCSTGATNVLRTVGKGPALFVLIFDTAKGAIAVYLALKVEAAAAYAASIPAVEWHWSPPVVALAALIGHSKSIFLKFQGGKSAATGLGTLLALNLAVGTVVFATWLLVLALTRIVSVASLVAVITSGPVMYSFGSPLSFVFYCLAGTAYVFWRHKENIKRLLAGTEPRIGQKAHLKPGAEDSQSRHTHPAS